MYIELLIKKINKEIEKMEENSNMKDTQKLADTIGLVEELKNLLKR